MTTNKIIAVFAGLVMIMAMVYVGILSRNSLKSYNYIGKTPERVNSITISGEGKVTAIPNIARIEVGYTAEKKTVVDAQKEAGEKINAVMDKLKNDFKIDDKDVKTTNYSIYPMYDWPNGKQVLRGYQVSQNVSIKVRDISQVSKILEMVANTGLNQVGGLSFEIDDTEALKQEARIKALEAAKTKAEALAEVAGVKLGKIVSFSESSSGDVYPTPYYAKEAGMGMGGGGAVAPSVQPGSNDIIVLATVEYEIE